MKAQERKKAILEWLAQESPLCGAALAARLGVSRQIVVRDVAQLKAEGHEILSAHNGYVLQKNGLPERVFKLHHTTEQTEDELSSIVSLGGTVTNVFVWHKAYGKITVPLQIGTAAQIAEFIDRVRSGKSTELMTVTGGYHYHTVRAASEEILDAIESALDRRGYIVPEI